MMLNRTVLFYHSFNSDGKRTNFSFDVVEMSPGSNMVNIGTWSDTYGLVINPRNPYTNPPSKKKGGGGGRNRDKTYVLTTVLEEPFLMPKVGGGRDVTDGNDDVINNEKYEGYVKDFATLIAREVGVSFEIRPTPDAKYGSPDPSRKGGWNGMIGELSRRDAEIAIGPLTISSERQQVVDFSTPFMPAEIAILVKEAKTRFQSPGLFAFLQPLSQEIWICIFCAYFGVSIVMFIVSRFSPSEWMIEDYSLVSGTRVENKFSIGNSLWFALSSLMQQSNEVVPRSLAGRIVGGSWWFFTVVLIASYTANMAAFLTHERMDSPVASADQLAHQTDIEYGTVLGGTTMSFFSKSRIPTYVRMWDFMVNRRDYVFVNSTREGVERVRNSRGRYAFLVESPAAEYANTRLPCDTVTATTRSGYNRNLNSGGGYGVATSKGSDLKEDVDKAILTLRESGHLAMLKAKWWYGESQCPQVDPDWPYGAGSGGGQLTLANLSGLFFILILGLISGMVLALVEFCHKSKAESKRGKIPFSDAVKTKARLAIQGGGGGGSGLGGIGGGGGSDRNVVGSEAARFYGGDSSAL